MHWLTHFETCPVELLIEEGMKEGERAREVEVTELHSGHVITTHCGMALRDHS